MIDKNLPNKLTMSRVIAIPIFIAFFMLSFRNAKAIHLFNTYEIDIFRLLSGLTFLLASITDYFDGKLARKYNLITNFGKLMDPLADKMIVVTALILLVESKEIHFICMLIVVLREIIISSIRLIALEENVVIAASIWGKLKTATQMIAITLMLFKIHNISIGLYYAIYGLFYISMVFVVLSLVDYIVKSKEIFMKKM